MREECTFNAKEIVSIKLFDKEKSLYEYYPEKKKTWYSSYKPAYFVYYNYAYTIEEIKEEGYLIIDNVPYWKPYVKITFSNNEIYEHDFNTFEEAEVFYKSIKETFLPLSDSIVSK